MCLHNHFVVGFKLTDFSKKRVISACWGAIACQQLLRANSQKLKNYFWRRAIIKGQHPHLITSRDLSNFSYHLTTNSPFSHLRSCSVKDVMQTFPTEKKLLSTDERFLSGIQSL